MTARPVDGFTSEAIARFWEANPCGADYVDATTWKEFFRAFDEFKYKGEPHIPADIEALNLRGLRVLEIGLGQGAEAQLMIQAGARYTGIDLTAESVRRVRLRCEIFDLAYDEITVMNAEKMAFPDESFDVVFSHGVIHHSPRIQLIVDEMHRVLKPGGRAVVMVYHRHSLNYLVSIGVIRRLGIFVLFVPGLAGLVSRLTGEPLPRLLKHKEALRANGPSYLRLESFIHKATDGPDNVYSSVHSASDAGKLFAAFGSLQTFSRMFHERHFPVVRSLLTQGAKRYIAERWGWHLWVIARK